ncbi:MAG TPA: AAA family ATPase, partial [Solirubrobacteraceae bacterium]
PRPLRWLWHPYLPLGKVSVLAGPPGQGKSQLALWLASLVTTGGLIDDVTEPADVVIISAEDDPNDTIMPRLIALHADFERVLILSVKDCETDGSLIDAALALPTDGPKLVATLKSRNVRLIVLDPVSAFLDAAIDSYKNASVRRALQPLKTVAEATNAAVLSVTHVTKGVNAGEPLDKVIDSVAFTAMSRSTLIMGPDPDDDEGTRGASKVLAIAKSNLAPPGDHAQRFELRSTSVPTELGPAATSFITQLGAAPDVHAGDILMPPDERSALADAVDWLRQELAAGWRPVQDVRKAADAHGHAWVTIKRARQVACGRPEKEHGGKGRWWMGLRGTRPEWADDDPLGPLDPQEGDHHARGPNLGLLDPLTQDQGQGDQGGQEDQREGDQEDQGTTPTRDDPLGLNGHHAEEAERVAADARRLRDRITGDRDWDEDEAS